MRFAEGIRVPEDVLVRELNGESVLLHLGSETYYGLDEVGTRFWRALAAGPDLAAARERLLGEYQVEPRVLEEDLQAFARMLCRKGLLEVQAPRP